MYVHNCLKDEWGVIMKFDSNIITPTGKELDTQCEMYFFLEDGLTKLNKAEAVRT